MCQLTHTQAESYAHVVPWAQQACSNSDNVVFSAKQVLSTQVESYWSDHATIPHLQQDYYEEEDSQLRFTLQTANKGNVFVLT